MVAEETEHFVVAVGFKTLEDAERFRERAMTEARHMGLFTIAATFEEFPDLKKVIAEKGCPVCGSLEHVRHEVAHP